MTTKRALALGFALVAGCPQRDAPQPPGEAPAPAESERAAPPMTNIEEGQTMKDEPDEPLLAPEEFGPRGAGQAIEASAARALNRFGWELWRRASGEGNSVMSPVSLQVALAMARDGARGPTAKQMDHALHLGKAGTADVANTAMRLDGYGSHELVELRVVNRLYGEQTYVFEAPFVAESERRWGAPLTPVDFQSQAEVARQTINGWVARQTRGRIEDLIPDGGVDAQTRLALVNALYFKGQWMTPFRENGTQPAFFHGAKGKTTVPMMRSFGTRAYGEALGAKWLRLDYEGGTLSMLFVLPDAEDGLAALEKRLDEASLAKASEAMTHLTVNVAIPKFRVAPARSMEVSAALRDMGMELAFTRLRADFTGIANPEDDAERLFISRVYHKGFVEIDEHGTEAAAASAVVMARSGARPAAEPKEFSADHPFLFFIQDRASGAIVFLGRVVDVRAD